MTEPQTSWGLAIFTAAVSLLGPTVGPFALLVFAAVIGGALGMGKETTKDGKPMTRMDGAMFIAVSAGVSMVLTGLCVWMVQRYTDIPGNIALMPLAFAIAAARSYLMGLIERMVGALGAAFEAILTSRAKP